MPGRNHFADLNYSVASFFSMYVLFFPQDTNKLFVGAGGLSTGLNSSKFVKTVGAVEWDIHAAETYAQVISGFPTCSFYY